MGGLDGVSPGLDVGGRARSVKHFHPASRAIPSASLTGLGDDGRGESGGCGEGEGDMRKAHG
ncbi:hypothetical protein NTCA1_05110 [Novosphingobium sp. TCA1]|nr:hypothetical protein NTCA1_05110 [Novosphingobium sp. TCA1]